MTVDLDAVDDELTPAQLAALEAMDGGFDPADLDPDDLDVDPPAEWLVMSPEERLAAPTHTVPEVLDAGFTHRDGGDGRGFAAGGVLDRMAPGGRLATITDRVWDEGLDRLSDYELIGLMTAARRGASRRPPWSSPRSPSWPSGVPVPVAVPASTSRRRSRRR